MRIFAYFLILAPFAWPASGLTQSIIDVTPTPGGGYSGFNYDTGSFFDITPTPDDGFTIYGYQAAAIRVAEEGMLRSTWLTI